MSSVSLFRLGFHRVRCLKEAFLPDLEQDFGSSRVEGMVGSLGMVVSVLSILLLKGPMGRPRDDLARDLFWSSRLPATSASIATYWLALCSISGTIMNGCFTSDQKK
ncbi:hypothetical protein BHE74_00056531 [Ensete ventricosum]|nr:hypothetical protein GW17_00018996 [Ensete ventricosum]RWW38249.1 hypothetical protein BHE74_00056531 [Ensete ventricosum]RZS28678.1 hypothetical protein BHM03_00062315 [Ensete ventricosum]